MSDLVPVILWLLDHFLSSVGRKLFFLCFVINQSKKSDKESRQRKQKKKAEEKADKESRRKGRQRKHTKKAGKEWRQRKAVTSNKLSCLVTAALHACVANIQILQYICIFFNEYIHSTCHNHGNWHLCKIVKAKGKLCAPNILCLVVDPTFVVISQSFKNSSVITSLITMLLYCYTGVIIIQSESIGNSITLA